MHQSDDGCRVDDVTPFSVRSHADWPQVGSWWDNQDLAENRRPSFANPCSCYSPNRKPRLISFTPFPLLPTQVYQRSSQRVWKPQRAASLEMRLPTMPYLLGTVCTSRCRCNGCERLVKPCACPYEAYVVVAFHSAFTTCLDALRQ